jgi:adenosylcobinamide-GDP ribazoletransferase
LPFRAFALIIGGYRLFLQRGNIMKKLLASCAIAFSTYSRLPTPQVEWTEENMSGTLACLPLVGAVVGVVYAVVAALGRVLGLGEILTAALLTAAPVAVTGGIHLDGYCDTVDALASHAPREKKLQILKDPNTGAFAVIWCCMWFLAYFGLTARLESPATVAAGFVLSRALAAWGVDRIPSARAGMGATLKSGSRFPWWTLGLYLAVYLVVVAAWGELLPGLVALVAAAVFYFLYRAMAMGQFGGFTGDLAGWFVQVCELVILAAVVLTERVAATWF